MPAFPKLPDKPGCLGFRKTVVLNLEEHRALNYLLDDAIKFCDAHEDEGFKIGDSRKFFVDLQEKLNAPTPNPN